MPSPNPNTPTGIPDLLDPAPGSVEHVDENGLRYNAVHAHGRWYHAWKEGLYPFPCDQLARDGEILLHGIVQYHCLGQRDLVGGGGFEKVVAVPLAGGRPRRVLDVGCGSGVWCSDIAKRFPDAQIVGIDLVEGQDALPNGTFHVPRSPHPPIDFTTPTPWPLPGRFDYIRLAHLNATTASEADLYSQCFAQSTPGSGHIEVTFVDWTFHSSAPTPLRASSPLAKLQTLLHRASWARQIPLNPSPATGSLLEDAGFADPVHRRFRLPLSPNSQHDARRHAIGLSMAALIDDSASSFNFLEGLALGLLTGWLGTSAQEVRGLVGECVKQAWEGEVYVECHVWTARRP